MWADEVWSIFIERGIESTPVVDDDGRPVGTLCRADVEKLSWRDRLDGHEDGSLALWLPEPEVTGIPGASLDPDWRFRWRVGKIMRPLTGVLSDNASVAEASALFEQTGLRLIAVVDPYGILVGTISSNAVARAALDQTRRVLVVDDDRHIREALSQVLTDEGYEVQVAENGATALTAIRGDRRPDLVLLDLMMPVMSGWQLLDVMEEDADLGAIPIVVVSALKGRDVARCFGVKKCLAKPVSVATLLEAVRIWSAPSEPAAGR